MRKSRLLTATALAGLMTGVAGLALGSSALADTSITTATTAPVVTSTAGNVTVSTAGSITLTSGTAITVDSNNTVTLNGPIAMSSSAAGSTGILISGGHASGLTIASSITVTDNFTAADTKNIGDLVLDGDFADHLTRYGIHSMGASPFVGDVNVTNLSTIQVEGDNSYGIRFENNVNGAFTFDGAIKQEGNTNTGISLENGVTGNVYLSGSVSEHGKDSRAINLGGNFDGNIVIDGTYTGTGYATTASVTADQLKAILTTPEDMYQMGPLVTISGNVAHGVLLGSAVTVDTTLPTNTDQNGDGVLDSSETTTATLSLYGSAPALLIGSATSDTVLHGLTYASTAISPPAINYGLLIRGSVSTYGTYSGIDSNAIQLGGLGHSVLIDGGIGIAGSVTSTAYGGTATAILLGDKFSTQQLDVTGAVAGSATSATTSDGATTPTYTTVSATARAIDIAHGATLPTINVSAGAAISAAATGSTDNATAIRDQSDTLTTIVNKNIISATITATDNNADGIADTIVNRAIAIDTRTNTNGLTLTQIDTAPTDSAADVAIAAPYISGDILLGSGNDVISSSGGAIYGNIDFGAGANSFTLTTGASYLGMMTGTGTVALDISAGSAGLLAGSSLNVTNLHVGATSTLALTLDPTHPTATILNGSGTAVFDNGAKLDLTVSKIFTTPTTFKVLTAAGGINLGSLATASTDGFIPYIYHADLTTPGGTELDAAFRLKTQTEAGYSANQYAALNPVLTAVANDPGATTALLSQLTKTGFDQVFNQYLPDYSGESILTLSLGSQSLNRTLGALTLIPSNDGGQYWLQEYGYNTKRGYGETAGFNSTGFSFAGGRERAYYGNQMVGFYVSYTSATPLDTFAIAKETMVNSDASIGAYWRINSNGFKGWAHAGAGYTDFQSTRELLNSYLTHISTATWNGYSTSAGAGASYEFKAGAISLTPQVLADYYSLSENKHSESGGGDYFDLNVAKRDGHLATATTLLNVSYNRSFIRPELWVGYKQNLSATLPDTVVNFNNQTPFTLTAGNLKGGGAIAGFRLSTDNAYSYFSLEGDYEKQNDYTNVSLALRARFQF